jgi:hypothetical protein
LNNPEENHKHFESLEHQRMGSLDAEPDTRDGGPLAHKTRMENAGAIVQYNKKTKK